jgi:rubredoxin
MKNFNLKIMHMKIFECQICGFIYDESLGIPEDGIKPGTTWDEVPTEWVCPDCQVGKKDFLMKQI